MASEIAVPRADVIDGYTLMPLRLPAFAQLRRHFDATHLRTAAIAAEGQSDAVEKRLMDAANVFIQRGNYAYGMPGFTFAIIADDNLPFLLSLCLKEKHPDITPAKAERLITDENRKVVYDTCLDFAGVTFGKKKAVTAGPANP